MSEVGNVDYGSYWIQLMQASGQIEGINNWQVELYKLIQLAYPFLDA